MERRHNQDLQPHCGDTDGRIGFLLQIPVDGRVWVFLLWRSGGTHISLLGRSDLAGKHFAGHPLYAFLSAGGSEEKILRVQLQSRSEKSVLRIC